MKMYVKPELQVIKLCVEEGIACFGSGNDHQHHGGGQSDKGHGKPGGWFGGGGWGWGWFFPW